MPVLRGSTFSDGGWIRATCSRLALAPAFGLVLACAAVVGLAGLVLPRVATAQIPSGCAEICGVTCVKPIAIPDRWDDVTPIAGYNGEGSGKSQRPTWANDAKYDFEQFTDVNGNGIWDPGEPYVDGNNNGKFDAEAYGPLTTGYIADPTAGNTLAPLGDLGLVITLYPAGSSAPTPWQYQPVAFPPGNKGAPVVSSADFENNWANCSASVIEPADWLQLQPGLLTGPTNQFMRDLIAQDPNAYWDPISQSVQGSAFALSPRVNFVVAYDPRIPVTSGRMTVTAAKVIPVFMEQMTGSAQVAVRFLRVATSGFTCTGSSAGGFFYECATPATRASWGHVKATYR